MHIIRQSETSLILPLRVVDDAGSPVLSLTHASPGLSVEYKRPDDAAWLTVTLESATVGTYTSGGFVSDAGADGWYQLGLPDAAIVAGQSTRLRVKTAANAYRYGTISATSVAPADIWDAMTADHDTAGTFGAAAGASLAGPGEGQYPITITVRDDNSVTINGATITITDENDAVVATASTRAAGTALIGLDPGQYNVLTTAGVLYTTDSQSITVLAAAPLSVTLSASPASTALVTQQGPIFRVATATDWHLPFTIGSLAGVDWSVILFTVKVSPVEEDDDELATIQVKLTNGGDVTDGLVRINGEAPGLGENLMASIEITDPSTGVGVVTILAEANEAITPTNQDYWEATDQGLMNQRGYRLTTSFPPPVMHYDVKRLDGDGSASPNRQQSLMVITQAVTQNVV